MMKTENVEPDQGGRAEIEVRYLDPDEIQERLREAYRLGIQPEELFPKFQTDAVLVEAGFYQSPRLPLFNT